MREIAVLLHNIRSAHNVGSIFRTADAAGVAKVFLSGYTPSPVDRFGYARKDVAKVALGAEKFVPWEYQKDPYAIITPLRDKGWHIIGIEQDARAIDYRTLKIARPTLFVLGNEVRGISPALRKKCDALIEIPMQGAMVRQAHHPRHVGRGKESLNVAVAAGVVLFSVR